MLSTSEKLTFTGTITESFVCFGYIFLLVVLSTTRIPALRIPFYRIFIVTGVAAVLNLIVVITLRMFNQVFYLGPEFGLTCNFLVYFSHIFVFAHSLLKAMQIINRFTAVFLPLRHDSIWSSSALWIVVAAIFILPVGIFSFMVINQKAVYIDVGVGIMKYASTDKTSQQMAKILISTVFGLFIVVTVPLNAMLILKMRKLRTEDVTLFNKERMYLSYVLVITAAHIIGGAHQILWLVATVTENRSLNTIAQYSYAYPNTIITFTSPVALILMSKQVRNEIVFFVTRRRIGSTFVDSNASIRFFFRAQAPKLLDVQEMDKTCYIEELPSELMWKIFEIVPESIFDLRSTSRLMRTHIDEFVLSTPPTPLVKELQFIGGFSESLTGKAIGIAIIVSKKELKLFELRLKIGQFPVKNLVKDEHDNSLKIREMVKYSLWLNDENASILDLLIDCMGSIDVATIHECERDSEFDVVSEILRRIQFKKLKVSNAILKDATVTHLLNVLSEFNVDQLALSVGDVICKDRPGVLLQISSLVHSLFIHQQFVEERHTAANRHDFFFGGFGLDWAPTFLEMFKRELEILNIHNYSYLYYLKKDSADFLVKNLPNLGKAVWFETNCWYPNEKNYTDSDHSVMVRKSEFFNILHIKHVMWQNKQFEMY